MRPWVTSYAPRKRPAYVDADMFESVRERGAVRFVFGYARDLRQARAQRADFEDRLARWLAKLLDEDEARRRAEGKS